MIRCDYGTPLWDEILGGAMGPGRRNLYEKGYGTTCGIVGYVLEQAGADSRLINRGGRFKIRAHISRLYEGGKAIGALRKDAEFEPGDVYCVLRDGGRTSGVVPEHVGIVLERRGEELVTGDGGRPTRRGTSARGWCGGRSRGTGSRGRLGRRRASGGSRWEGEV